MAGSSRSPVAVLRRRVLAGAAAVSSQLVVRRPASADARSVPAARATGLDLDRFVEDCVKASSDSDPQHAVLDVLARGVRDPRAMLLALGEPQEAGIRVLHRSKTLTIFSAAWTPQMNLMPHNHLMWANIGIYTGREDNILWRRTPDSIEAFGAKALFQGQSTALGADTIHSVTNPLGRFTGGVHIYGGDFFATTRSQWNSETLGEEPSDGAAIRRMFELENEKMRARS